MSERSSQKLLISTQHSGQLNDIDHAPFSFFLCLLEPSPRNSGQSGVTAVTFHAFYLDVLARCRPNTDPSKSQNSSGSRTCDRADGSHSEARCRGPRIIRDSLLFVSITIPKYQISIWPLLLRRGGCCSTLDCSGHASLISGRRSAGKNRGLRVCVMFDLEELMQRRG